MIKKGVFLISLDFELSWGMPDGIGLENCKDDVLSVWQIIPRLLELFDEYKIHATWATVGFIFFNNKAELLSRLPKKIPAYLNQKISAYNHIDNIGNSEEDDPLHYGPSLIKLISSCHSQEVATHTFSHYSCLEEGQNKDDFSEDLKLAVAVAKKFNINIKSIVFPYNQINNQYLSACSDAGITSYRGNELSWIYTIKKGGKESLIRRLFRLADSYINITGHNAYSFNNSSARPMNIPSSRFLRPCLNSFKFLDQLRLHRILIDLDYAAKNNLVYHLWWHPRNFGKGTEIEKNFSFLRIILDHFLDLQKKYGMESLNMGELTSKILEN